MSLGVCLKGLNAFHFKSWIDLFFEFLPQLTFLLALFGTMNVLLVAKWLTDWTGREHQAPSIITQMINNVLRLGEVHGSPLLGSEQTQTGLVQGLLIVCLLCVPIMLLVKPWYINR